MLLAPPFNTDEKDLGGSVLADGEEVPAAASNQVARPARMKEEAAGGLSERNGKGGAGARGTRNREGGNASGSPGETGARRGGNRTNLQEMIKLLDKNVGGRPRNGSAADPAAR